MGGARFIDDIKSLCDSIDVSFCQIKRSTNKVADFITKYVNKNGWSSVALSRTAIFDHVVCLCKADFIIYVVLFCLAL